MKYRCLYIVFFLLVLAPQLKAQSPKKLNNDITFPSFKMELRVLNKDKVVIISDNQQTLNFSLSYTESNWTSFSIKNKERLTIDLKSNPKLFIKICTEGFGCLQYYLLGGNRYALEVNKKTKKWDVFRIE